MPKLSHVRFVEEFLSESVDTGFMDGVITDNERHMLRRNIAARKHDLSRALWSGKDDAVTDPSFGRIKRRRLRHADLREFDFLIVEPRRRPPRIECFVGHRFLENFEKSLRFNLRHVFEPYGIDAKWSGRDIAARDILSDILALIKHADFCLFDNQGTVTRPNVYIEAGIAYALARPMIFCEYVGTQRHKPPPDTGSIPSDLSGLLRLQYRDYEELCRQLYFKLPTFLDRNGLRRSRR
jgi:hypothetical protein